MLLEISDLRKSFLTPDGSDHCVVNVKTFALAEQAQAALEGESGSGKTTFLHLIAGILKPDAGHNGRMIGKGVKPVIYEPVTVCGTFPVGDVRERGRLIRISSLGVEKLLVPTR